MYRIGKERIENRTPPPPYQGKNSLFDTFLYRKPLFNYHFGESI